MKKRLLVNLAVFIASIVIASLVDARPNASFMNTIYTVAGIMFSIGMGVICTFSPDKIKNKSYFNSIKENINSVRDSFLFYFSIISVGFLAYQTSPSLHYKFTVKGLNVFIDFSWFVSLLIAISIIYFILNFLAIQRLNFDISERTNGGSS